MSLDGFNNLPEVNFITKTFEEILSEQIAQYEAAYLAQTGEAKTLAPGDPIRIYIVSNSLTIYQQQVVINNAAKQNLLRYAAGDFLDNLGALVGEIREPATSAVDIERFTLSAIQPGAINIPLGTRVSAGDGVLFQTTEAGEVTIGELTTDIAIEAVIAGVPGNGYTAGQLNVLVDPIAFVESVENLSTTQGGADIEDDDSFSAAIFLKPTSFSSAGPIGAYEFYTKEVSTTIGDVSVTNPDPGEVLVEFILADGELPAAGLINQVDAALSDETVRPLTDDVTVAAPGQTGYNIDFTYYINQSDAATVADIQAAVTQAVADYTLWQKTKIGRDINPDELITRVLNAGAKRLVVTVPAYAALTNTVALEGTTDIVYGGLEDD